MTIEDHANYVATKNNHEENPVSDRAKAVAEKSTVDNIVAHGKTTK